MATSIERRVARQRLPRIEIPEPWVSQVDELGHEFEYHFEPIRWFDARKGYERVDSVLNCRTEGYPTGCGNLWRSRSGEIVVRLTHREHRISFKVLKEFEGLVLDDEIYDVEDDPARLIALWIYQGSDDWPEICSGMVGQIQRGHLHA